MNKAILALSALLSLLFFMVAPSIVVAGLFIISAWLGLTYAIYKLITGWMAPR